MKLFFTLLVIAATLFSCKKQAIVPVIKPLKDSTFCYQCQLIVWRPLCTTIELIDTCGTQSQIRVFEKATYYTAGTGDDTLEIKLICNRK